MKHATAFNSSQTTDEPTFDLPDTADLRSQFILRSQGNLLQYQRFVIETFKAGDYRGCLAFAERALQIDPTNAAVLNVKQLLEEKLQADESSDESEEEDDGCAGDGKNSTKRQEGSASKQGGDSTAAHPSSTASSSAIGSLSSAASSSEEEEDSDTDDEDHDDEQEEEEEDGSSSCSSSSSGGSMVEQAGGLDVKDQLERFQDLRVSEPSLPPAAILANPASFQMSREARQQLRGKLADDVKRLKEQMVAQQLMADDPLLSA